MVLPIVNAALDVEGLVRDWLNTLTDTLVGKGKPVDLGFFLVPHHSPGDRAYGLISRVGGDQVWLTEADSDRARLSVSFYARRKSNAEAATRSYVNHMIAVGRAGGVTLPGTTVRLQTVDAITGPIYLPVTDEQRYLVDADFYLVPVA